MLLRSRLRSLRTWRLFVIAGCVVASLLLLLLHLSDSSWGFLQQPKVRHEWGKSNRGLAKLSEPLSFEMAQIRQAAADAWSAYARTGMAGDDLRPIQGGTIDYMHVHATLFDSLDTLYVMGLHAEFDAAVESVVALGAPRTLLFPTSSFEYNIRIVGGLLSAAQLSRDERLLALARDAAHTLLSSAYVLWPSALLVDRVRMQPLTLRNLPFWIIARVMDAAWMLWLRVRSEQGRSSLAKVGSFSLEFRALSSALGDPLYSCIADKMQRHIVGNVTLPWRLGQNMYHHTPIYTGFDSFDGRGHFDGTVSFGSGNDSFYEYLLKAHIIMPQDSPHLYVELYRRLAMQLNYEYDQLVDDPAADAGESRGAGESPRELGESLASSPPALLAHLLTRFPGDEYAGPKLLFAHQGRLFLSSLPGGHYHEQLACFLPGVMLLGAMMLPDRAMSRDREIAEKLLDGCLWTYREPLLSSNGLGADFNELQDEQEGEEEVHLQNLPEPPPRRPPCRGDCGYLLRPETVESVFVAWRTTRNPKWREAAWDIFTALKRLQVGSGGFHGIADVTMRVNASENVNVVDEQPSFFIAETLKYLFLTFDDPERLSLNDWVFSTECHPFSLSKSRDPRPARSCDG